MHHRRQVESFYYRECSVLLYVEALVESQSQYHILLEEMDSCVRDLTAM